MLLYITLLSISLISTLIAYYSWKTGISPMPSSPRARKAILSLIPLNFSGTVYELGSGWGSLSIPLAKKFKNAKIVAFELSLIPYLWSKLIIKLLRLENIELKQLDFMSIKWNNADIITCYLYPAAMRKISKKLKLDKVNAIIISNSFHLPGHKANKELIIKSIFSSSIYLYS